MTYSDHLYSHKSSNFILFKEILIKTICGQPSNRDISLTTFTRVCWHPRRMISRAEPLLPERASNGTMQSVFSELTADYLEAGMVEGERKKPTKKQDLEMDERRMWLREWWKSWGKREEEEEEPRGRSGSSLEKTFSSCDGEGEKKKYWLNISYNIILIYEQSSWWYQYEIQW